MIAIKEAMYDKIKSIISTWNEESIYAISFFVYSNEAYEYNEFNNISTFAISYNTEDDCDHSDQYSEKRWNYAFWRQDEFPIIDPYVSDSLIDELFMWYKENGIKNIGYEDNESCYDNEMRYIGKGPIGHYELINLVSEVAKELQEDGFIEAHFQKKLPIIIHGLEYAWYDIEATKKANPHGEADVFLAALKKIGMIE